MFEVELETTVVIEAVVTTKKNHTRTQIVNGFHLKKT